MRKSFRDNKIIKQTPNLTDCSQLPASAAAVRASQSMMGARALHHSPMTKKRRRAENDEHREWRSNFNVVQTEENHVSKTIMICIRHDLTSEASSSQAVVSSILSTISYHAHKLRPATVYSWCTVYTPSYPPLIRWKNRKF